MNISELIQQKKEKIDAATEIRTRVYGEQAGEWRGDDHAKFDTLMADAEAVGQDVERLVRLEEFERSLDDTGKPNESRTQPQLHTPSSSGSAMTRPQAVTNEDRALALHAWIAYSDDRTKGVVTDQHRSAAERCGISLGQKQLTMRLPLKAPRGISIREWEEWEQRLTQVDVVSPDLGGHYTVPDEMMQPLERAMLAFGGMRQVATILRTNTGAALPIPTNNDTSNTGALLGEGLEHTELDIQFSQLVLNAYKYTSRRVGMSVEYIQDNAIAATNRIGEILGERIGRITNTHFTTGTGTAQPNGIVTAATDSAITLASETTPTRNELIDIKHTVDPAYRNNARWMFNDTMLANIKKIIIPQYSGDTAGAPLWQAGLAVGEPNTIDGDPYVINQDMPTADAESPTAGEKALIYGALDKYIVRDVRDITLVRLDERYAELGVVAFLAFSRHDGDLLDAGTNPVKYATSA